VQQDIGAERHRAERCNTQTDISINVTVIRRLHSNRDCGNTAISAGFPW